MPVDVNADDRLTFYCPMICTGSNNMAWLVYCSFSVSLAAVVVAVVVVVVV